ncbi:MAG: CPBP family intramembrane metalloprotease [Flavobacterium sp.]|nr:CPBP family intramembrane metalloprotease [Flavobacterium sp.]
MKNKYLLRAVSLIIFVFIYLVLTRQLVSVFYSDDNKNNLFIIQSIIKMPLLFLTLFLISKEKKFNHGFLYKNIFLGLLICSLLIYFSLHFAYIKISTYKVFVTSYDFYSYLSQCLVTGFFEEFFFRVLIFGYICLAYSNYHYKNYYREVILTSFLFAIAHLSGIFNKNIDMISIVNQVMFAFLIGIVLQAIMYRFNNIFLNSIIHGLINFNGMLNQKLLKLKRVEEETTAFEDFSQSLFTFILLGVLVVFPIFYFSFRRRKNHFIEEHCE